MFQSPRLTTTATPASDSSMPNSCHGPSRSPNNRNVNATRTSEPVDCRMTALIASVYCKP